MGEKLPPNFVLDGRVIAPETELHGDMSQKLRRDGTLLIFRVEFSLHQDFVDVQRYWGETYDREAAFKRFCDTLPKSWHSQGKRDGPALQRAFDFGAAFNRKGPYA